jgi:hypothetical protein
MSKTVWTAAKGWHDGGEVEISTVAALADREDLQLVSDSQDVESIRDNFGPEWAGRDYG